MGPCVVIIGAGFGGLGAARELLRQGLAQITPARTGPAVASGEQ